MFANILEGIIVTAFDILLVAVPIALWVGISSTIYFLCRLCRLTPYDYSEYFSTGWGYVTGIIGLLATIFAAVPFIPK